MTLNYTLSLLNHIKNFGYKKKLLFNTLLSGKKVKVLLIAFPASYLVENGFSSVSQLLGKQRLRLNLTNIQPDLEKIVSRHQVHPAHGKPTERKEVVIENSVTSKDI